MLFRMLHRPGRPGSSARGAAFLRRSSYDRDDHQDRKGEEGALRVLLTGASGQLGAYVLAHLADRGHQVLAWSGTEAGERGGIPLRPLDLGDLPGIAPALDRADPEAVLHAAAMSSAAEAHRDPERARLVNVEATRRIAGWCRENCRRLVFTSTDLVFDGRKPWSRESDPAEPVLTYGRTKREAEGVVLEAPLGLVARVSLLYGPSRSGRPSYFDRSLASLRRGESQTFFEDEFRTPLDLVTAAEALVGLTEAGATGVVHVGGAERVSRYDLMRRIATVLGLDPGLVRANRQADVPSPEPRPADASLESTRLASLLPGLTRPPIEEAARRFRDEVFSGDAAR